MASKYNGQANHPRDESHSDKGSHDGHLDKKHCNEMHDSHPRPSPSTFKSPQVEGGSQISNLTNQGSTTKKLEFDSVKRDMALRVNLEVKNGEYNLKLTSVQTNNAIIENAHTAAMLLSQGKLLCKLGEKLLSQLGKSSESEICKSLNLQFPF